MPFDNSLEPLIRNPAKNPTSVDLTPFARSEWRVCGQCGLMFSLARPVYERIVSWYGAVFEVSEKRKYNLAPLPEIYVKNSALFANELFDRLADRGLFEGVRSVLHIRSQSGEFLRLVRDRLGIENIYGLEYFEHPIAHGAVHLGEDRVRIMTGPEPEIPFPQAQYDLIVLDHVFTHVENPRRYLNYLKGLLAPGGRMVLKDKCHREVFSVATSYERGINFFHFQLYSVAELTSFLRSGGMEVERLPDPTPRKWAVGHGSFLLTCTPGETVEIGRGNVEGNVDLLSKWWRRHVLLRKASILPKPWRRKWGKLIETVTAGP